jgi:hypothetical protein
MLRNAVWGDMLKLFGNVFNSDSVKSNENQPRRNEGNEERPEKNFVVFVSSRLIFRGASCGVATPGNNEKVASDVP